MSDGAAFLVEDFVHSIAAQLDRVQDALRLKAVNRPLTYALKDFALDLHVYPEVDTDGQVRFRTAGANETGASTVRLAFTTITRPMIEENTVSLQASQGPTLDETSLDPDEKRRLQNLGVRNVAQLQRLQSQAGSGTVQRLANVPAARLKAALSKGKPAIDRVSIVPPARGPVASAPPPSAPRPAPAPAPPKVTAPPPPIAKPDPRPSRPAPVFEPGGKGGAAPPVRVRLEGRNLLARAPRVTVDDRPVTVASLDDDAMEVDVPSEGRSMTLELDDGEVHVIDLAADAAAHAAAAVPAEDPWGGA